MRRSFGSGGMRADKPVSFKPSSGGNGLQNMMMAQMLLPEKLATTEETKLKYLPQEEAIKSAAKGQSKIAEEEANVSFGAKKQLTASNRFVQQFERSYDELNQAVPGFSDVGTKGKLRRAGAGIKTFMGQLPETEAFSVELAPMANQMARDVEGGKITDTDREIYWKAFANTISHPSATNARLVANSLISLADKGADISKNLEAFSTSKNPVIQKVYSYVTEAYPQFSNINSQNSFQQLPSAQGQAPQTPQGQPVQTSADPLDEWRNMYLK